MAEKLQLIINPTQQKQKKNSKVVAHGLQITSPTVMNRVYTGVVFLLNIKIKLNTKLNIGKQYIQ